MNGFMRNQRKKRPSKNFIMFYLYFYVILCRTTVVFLYRITLVELIVVYPFFLSPTFLMYLFIYLFILPYHVNML